MLIKRKKKVRGKEIKRSRKYPDVVGRDIPDNFNNGVPPISRTSRRGDALHDAPRASKKTLLTGSYRIISYASAYTTTTPRSYAPIYYISALFARRTRVHIYKNDRACRN